MNKQTVYDDRSVNMLSFAMKTYSGVVVMKNYSLDTIKNYRIHFEAFSNNHVHKNLRIKMIYTRASKVHLSHLQSPLDKIKIYKAEKFGNPRYD